MHAILTSQWILLYKTNSLFSQIPFFKVDNGLNRNECDWSVSILKYVLSGKFTFTYFLFREYFAATVSRSILSASSTFLCRGDIEFPMSWGDLPGIVHCIIGANTLTVEFYLNNMERLMDFTE